MATIRAYTTIEQSKKLAEILPIESADMCWTKYIDNGDITSLHATVNYRIVIIDYPCWSLSALLGVLPNKIVSRETAFEGEDAEGINDIYHKCIKPTEDGRYMCCYLGNGYKYKYIADNPVDACVAMVEKLHELKIL